MANENLHRDVLKLLDTYKVVPSPSASLPTVASPVSMANGEMALVNGYGHHGSKPSAKKKTARSKSTGHHHISNGDIASGGHEKAEKKTRSRKKRSSTDVPTSASLSPAGSLESPRGYERTSPPYLYPSQSSASIVDPADLHFHGMTNGMQNGIHHVPRYIESATAMNGNAHMSHSMQSLNRKTVPNGEIGSDIGASAVAVPCPSDHQWGNANSHPHSQQNHRPREQHGISPQHQGTCTSPPGLPPLLQHSMSNGIAAAAVSVSSSASAQYTSPTKGFPNQHPHVNHLPHHNHHMPRHPSQYNNGDVHMNGHVKSPIHRAHERSQQNMRKQTQQHHNHVIQTQLPNPNVVSIMTDKYPTPPSQHSQGGSPCGDNTPHMNAFPETYLTPSPESPGQWSSSSPHSSAHSDWSGSEGISSPPGPTMNGHTQDSLSLQYSQTPQVYI